MAQGDSQWFKDRAGRITGSRFKSVMAGKSTAAYKKLIYGLALERMAGTCLPTYQNAAMLRGTELEGAAREAYEIETLTVVDQIDFVVHPEYDFIGVSPDGLTSTGLVEIKVPAEESHHKHVEHYLHGAYCKEYQWQLQGQLWVTGRDTVDVVSFWPEAVDFNIPVLAIEKQGRDDVMIEKLEARCMEANEEIEAIMKKLIEKAGTG